MSPITPASTSLATDWATGLAVGTALFVDPATPVTIMQGLSDYLAQQGAGSINDIIGTLEMP